MSSSNMAGNAFCTKCGAKLVPESRFCTGCGCEISSFVPKNNEYNEEIAPSEEPVKEGGSASKIVLIIILSVVGAAVLFVGGIIGYKMYMDAKESKSQLGKPAEEVIEEAIEEATEDEVVPEDTDSGEVTDSSKTIGESSEDEVGSLSSSNISSYNTVSILLDIGSDYFSDRDIYSFLYGSLDYLDYVGNRYSLESEGSYIKMSIDDFTEYMKNTVGTGTVDGLQNHDNNSIGFSKDNKYVYFFMDIDSEDYVEEMPAIDSIQDSGDGKLIVYAHQDYHYGSGEVDTYSRIMKAVLKYNGNSIWDKMQMESYEIINEDHYFLPYVQDKVYDLDTLYYETNWSEFDYHCARNEMFARHGRKFKTPEIQEYFNKQSWYNGVLEDYPTEMLSDIERANINVLDKYKKKMGYN